MLNHSCRTVYMCSARCTVPFHTMCYVMKVNWYLLLTIEPFVIIVAVFFVISFLGLYWLVHDCLKKLALICSLCLVESNRTIMGRQLSSHLYRRVIDMRNGGYKQNDISNALGITQGAVSKILKRRRETGTPTPRPRSGRPRRTTAREDRSLQRL